MVEYASSPTTASDPFTRGFPMDLPIRAANLIVLDYRAATRNHIHIMLPELVNTTNHGQPLMLCMEDGFFQWRCDADGSLRHTYEKSDVLALEGAVYGLPDGEGVNLELTLTNRSPHDWTGVSAGICVRFHGAPDFYDPDRKRTYYLSEGKLRTMEGPVISTAEGACLFYGVGRDPSYTPEDAPFIAIQSEDGEHTVAQWWEGGERPHGNVQGSCLCTHAGAHFDDIPAGESVTRHGWLYLMRGTAADALERYRHDSATTNPTA